MPPTNHVLDALAAIRSGTPDMCQGNSTVLVISAHLLLLTYLLGFVACLFFIIHTRSAALFICQTCLTYICYGDGCGLPGQAHGHWQFGGYNLGPPIPACNWWGWAAHSSTYVSTCESLFLCFWECKMKVLISWQRTDEQTHVGQPLHNVWPQMHQQQAWPLQAASRLQLGKGLVGTVRYFIEFRCSLLLTSWYLDSKCLLGDHTEVPVGNQSKAHHKRNQHGVGRLSLRTLEGLPCTLSHLSPSNVKPQARGQKFWSGWVASLFSGLHSTCWAFFVLKTG